MLRARRRKPKVIRRDIIDSIQVLDAQRHRAKRRRTLTSTLAIADVATNRRETHQRITETLTASAENEMGLIVKLFQERGVIDSSPQPIVRNFNAGHYIRTAGANGNPPTDWDQLLTANVRGFLKGYQWKVLEPQLGNYDGLDPITGTVGQDLQWLADNTTGARLVLMIVDRNFNAVNPAPSYFGTPGAADGSTVNPYVNFYSGSAANGCVMARWNTKDVNGDTNGLNVRTRMKQLIDAIADLCDGHPNFEGLYFQETALGYSVAQKTATNYTAENYRDYYIDILTYAANKMPHSRIFWCMNYIPQTNTGGHSNEIVDDILAGIEGTHAVVFGGPDALAEDGTLVSEEFAYMGDTNFTISGQTCHGYKNRIPSSIQVSPPCYGIQWKGTNPLPARYWTLQELYDWMKNTDSHKGNALFASYVFWYAVNGASNSADTDLGAPYNGYTGGGSVATPFGKTIVANNPLIYNYTGPK